MKKTYQRLTMLLCLLLLLAAPAQIFGATKDCTSYYSRNNAASCKGWYQLCQQSCSNGYYLNLSKAFLCKRGVCDNKPTWTLDGNCYGNAGNFGENCGRLVCTPAGCGSGDNGSANAGSNVDVPDQNDDSAAAKPSPATSSADYAVAITELVNQERAEDGLSALTLNNELSAVAQAKAQDMADNNYFSHTSPTYGSPFQMMKTFGVSYSNAGENIAKGYIDAKTVMQGWMNSQGHKANILSYRFTEIGVGYVKADDGSTYWVQLFRKP